MGLDGFDLRARMQAHSVPGVSVAVIAAGGVVNAFSEGVLAAGTTDPVTTDTVFQVASITKPLAGIIAMQQIGAGAFSLDTPVNSILKRWRLPDNEFTRKTPVTVRHLLAHTGGMNVTTFPGYGPGRALPSLLQVLTGEPPAGSDPVRVLWEPGTRFHYSSGAYVLLQVLLEDVTAMPLEDLMTRNIFSPLGMHHSTMVHPPSPDRFRRVSAGHDENGMTVKGRFHRYPEQAAASLWSTPQDLALVAGEMQSALRGEENRLLKPELGRQMVEPVLESFFGLGFALWEKGGHYFGHTGTTCGFRSLLIANRDKKEAAIVLTNSANGEALYKEVINTIAHRYGWAGFDW